MNMRSWIVTLSSFVLIFWLTKIYAWRRVPNFPVKWNSLELKSLSAWTQMSGLFEVFHLQQTRKAATFTHSILSYLFVYTNEKFWRANATTFGFTNQTKGIHITSLCSFSKSGLHDRRLLRDVDWVKYNGWQIEKTMKLNLISKFDFKISSPFYSTINTRYFPSWKKIQAMTLAYHVVDIKNTPGPVWTLVREEWHRKLSHDGDDHSLSRSTTLLHFKQRVSDVRGISHSKQVAIIKQNRFKWS